MYPNKRFFAPGAKRIALPRAEAWGEIEKYSLLRAISDRRSVRTYADKPLSIAEISFLLWATQGIQRVASPERAFRTVPSGGCRHPFETYLCVLNVKTLTPGIYRYLPLEHELLFEFTEDSLAQKIVTAAMGQPFVGQAACTFIWTVIPYRKEWRYGPGGHKSIALDAGHVCQNLYLACEAVHAGTCAVAAYDQEFINRLLRVDGREEFVVYLAPVGKVHKP